jgi:hypothetical protein
MIIDRDRKARDLRLHADTHAIDRHVLQKRDREIEIDRRCAMRRRGIDAKALGVSERL